MNKATRYLAVLLTLVFLLSGLILVLRRYTEGDGASYPVAFALIGMGSLAAWTTWGLGLGLDASGESHESNGAESAEREKSAVGDDAA